MYTEVLTPRIMLTAEVPPPAEETPPPAEEVPPPAEETVDVVNEAPSVFVYAMTTGSGMSVEVSGWVIDEEPNGLTVTFSGVVTATATVNEFGNFTVITTASGLGTISATVADASGLTGTSATQLTNSAPQITSYSVIQLTVDIWQISGTVADEAPAGLVVTFGGDLPSGLSAVVEANGTFVQSFTWTPNSSGLATAVVDDVWSQTSNIAQDYFIA